MQKKHRSRNAFTLIEVLLSIALIANIAGLSIPVYQSFQVRNGIDLAVLNFVQSARRAWNLAIASEHDSSWGVRAEVGKITLFKGESFSARDTSYDETFDVLEIITISGNSEIVFAKFTGLPSVSGTITFSAEQINQKRTVTINSKGMIDY